MSQTSRRRFLALSAASGLLPAFSWAQTPASATWPTRPVRLLVAYPPGGVSDVVARLLAERLQGPLGQPVVIENKAGASGAIAMDAVAKSAPDGYTLGFSAISPLTLSPHLGKLPYDPAHDLLPVVNVMASPVLLLATPGSGLADFAGLLAQARSNAEIARELYIGEATVKTHVSNVLQKLGARDRVHAAVLAHQHGLV
jgi:tripartite-type tricarboxylate transporter receptor subunit TctC